MSSTEKRSHARELIDRIDDEFFDAVYALMETYVRKQESAILGYAANGDPVSAGDFLEQADEEVRRAKNGEGISVDDLRKESNEWLARNK